MEHRTQEERQELGMTEEEYLKFKLRQAYDEIEIHTGNISKLGIPYGLVLLEALRFAICELRTQYEPSRLSEVLHMAADGIEKGYEDPWQEVKWEQLIRGNGNPEQ